MTSVTGAITQELVYQVAYEANKRAAIVLPQDSLTAFGEAFQRETKPLAHFILGQLLENSKLAIAESRPMCGDTGLPRYYVKVGNNAVIEGGFFAMARSFRQAGRYSRAALHYRKILLREPGHSAANIELREMIRKHADK